MTAEVERRLGGGGGGIAAADSGEGLPDCPCCRSDLWLAGDTDGLVYEEGVSPAESASLCASGAASASCSRQCALSSVAVGQRHGQAQRQPTSASAMASSIRFRSASTVSVLPRLKGFTVPLFHGPGTLKFVVPGAGTLTIWPLISIAAWRAAAQASSCCQVCEISEFESTWRSCKLVDTELNDVYPQRFFARNHHGMCADGPAQKSRWVPPHVLGATAFSTIFRLGHTPGAHTYTSFKTLFEGYPPRFFGFRQEPPQDVR